MIKNNPSLVCFSSIHVAKPIIEGKKSSAVITLTPYNEAPCHFRLQAVYGSSLDSSDQAMVNLAFCIPLLNYGLFSKSFHLDFPLNQSDIDLLSSLNIIFSADIFVNKILRRRTNYIHSEYFPNEKNISKIDAHPKATFLPASITTDSVISSSVNHNRYGILSSGGKESLLTYGILKEIDAAVYPLYVNESGGHWRTALEAYRYHTKVEARTGKVWTNIDRFYNFMLDHLLFIRGDHRKIRADTYPIRLCIFPFYVFLLLPLFVKNRIGNLLIGSEFDDLRTTPTYAGINHYYGVYDQHQDFDVLMNQWYAKRIPGLIQWSAVRGISGLIVERILVNRYPDLARRQRSCHSCHIKNNKIIPCGKCSKCMGVLLFLLANKTDPKIMNFSEHDIIDFPKRITSSNLRLDQDEKDQSFYLIHNRKIIPDIKPVDHIEQIHIDPVRCSLELIPPHFRLKLLHILEQYTTGYCELKNEQWVPIKKPTEKKLRC